LLDSTGNHIVIESDLIQGCIKGDRKMQEMLYLRHSPKMYAVCLRYAGNSNDAEDLLQEGFIKVFRNLEKYRGDGSFEGWMRRIFVNTSIEHFRRKIKMNNVSEVPENSFEDKEWNAFESMAEKDIIKIIQQLSPGYRQVFNMYVIEGYSHKEIGEILGISEGTSKSQLARARGLLQTIIADKLNLN
jgi:RNA polymerase sigma-70 factor (ECF subfamily)